MKWRRSPRRTRPVRGLGAGDAPSRAKVVETFEALARLCGTPTVSAEGLRLFGGHTARVTGAQTLAACGVEVDKIRILARHSGDAVLRYVAEAPLRTLRADLGLPAAAVDSAQPSGATLRSMQSQLAAEAMGKQQEMQSSATNERDGREDDNTGRFGGGGGGLDDTFGSDLELMEDLIRGDDDQSRGAASRGATKGRGSAGASAAKSGKLQRRGRSSGMEDFEGGDGGGGDDDVSHDDRVGAMDTMDNLDILEDDIVQEVAKDNLRVGTVGVGRGGGSMLEELP